MHRTIKDLKLADAAKPSEAQIAAVQDLVFGKGGVELACPLYHTAVSCPSGLHHYDRQGSHQGPSNHTRRWVCRALDRRQRRVREDHRRSRKGGCRKNFPDRPSLSEDVDKFVRCVVGADISETSMLYLAHYTASAGGMKCMTGEDEGDAQYQRLVDGTQRISEAIVARLPKDTVLLNHPVNAISQAYGIVTITTKNRRSFRARKGIITIPPPLWNSITWSPSLPERKIIISDNLTMPTYSKIVFAFDTQWWRPKLSGGVIFAKGPIQMIRDTSGPLKNCFTLTCFATGKRGADWGAQSRERRRTSAWEALCSAFANYVDEIPQPVAYREMLWERHEYFGGAPSSSWPPGMLSKGFQKDLKAPHLNVHFAGSETSSHFKGFMEGGLFAARRAVEEIVQSLNRNV